MKLQTWKIIYTIQSQILWGTLFANFNLIIFQKYTSKSFVNRLILQHTIFVSIYLAKRSVRLLFSVKKWIFYKEFVFVVKTSSAHVYAFPNL